MRTVLIHAACVVLLLGASCTGGAVETSKAFPDDTRTAELAAAAASGDASRVAALVQAGANPNAHGDKGVTPLQFALLAENTDGMRALLAAGADPNLPGLGGASVVHMAAIADDPKYLELLLESGANPDVRHAETGATPLAGATGPRTDAQFRMLLDAGADPDAADRTGDTPLHAAARINAGAHVLALLEKGVNPEARNAQGKTFQPAFFRTEDALLTDEARSNRQRVRDWLKANGFALEAASG